MATHGEFETPAQKAGIVIFVLPLVVCSMEMMPGWGMFGLAWPEYYFYAIMAACGGIGGALMGGRYWIPGLLGGAVAGVGSLYATALVLAKVREIHSIILVVVGGIGCLPGVILYWVLRYVQISLLPANDADTFGIDGMPGRGPVGGVGEPEDSSSGFPDR